MRSIRISLLDILLYGNLIFLALMTPLGYSDLYPLISMLLNVVILLANQNIKITKYSLLVLSIFLFSIFGAYENLGTEDFLKVLVRLVWIITSVFCGYTLLTNKNIKVFETFQNFFVIFSSLLILDYTVSYFYHGYLHMPREGLLTIFFLPTFVKTFSLMAIPFLVTSSWRNKSLALFLAITLLFGARAEMLALSFSVIMIIIFYVKEKIKAKRIAKFLTFLVLVIPFMASIFLVVSSIRQNEEVGLLNDSSMQARFVIWMAFVSTIKDYPLGLGPTGAYYKLSENGFEQTDLEINFDNDHLDNQEIERRIRIINDKRETRGKWASEESTYVEIISAFGLGGILFITYMLGIMFKDFFKHIYTNSHENVKIIYISLSSLLIYGIFDSFHKGILYGSLMIILYFNQRKYI